MKKSKSLDDVSTNKFESTKIIEKTTSLQVCEKQRVLQGNTPDSNFNLQQTCSKSCIASQQTCSKFRMTSLQVHDKIAAS